VRLLRETTALGFKDDPSCDHWSWGERQSMAGSKAYGRQRVGRHVFAVPDRSFWSTEAFEV